jgi:WD40 repeat protein
MSEKKEDKFKTSLHTASQEYDKIVSENAELKKKIQEMQKIISSYEKTTTMKPQEKGSNAEKFKKTFVDIGNKVSSVLHKTNSSIKFHRDFLAHSDVVWSVRVLPMYSKSSYIATTSADTTCLIWSPDWENPVVSYTGHSGSVNQVRFHPTSTLACSASGDGSFHLWKFGLDPKKVMVSPRVRDLNTSQDDSHPEVKSDEEKPHVEEQHELEQCQTVQITTAFKKFSVESIIADCDWSIDGNYVATGSWDGVARFFSIGENITQIGNFKGHEGRINGVSIGNQNNLVMSCSRDKTVRLWDTKTGECSTIIKAHNESVSSAVWSSNDKMIVTGSDDGDLKYWDLKNLKTPLKTVHVRSPINKISISSYHSRIGITMTSRRPRIYDMSGTLLTYFPKSHKSMAMDCTWNSDGSVIYTSSTDGSAKQWLYNTEV